MKRSGNITARASDPDVLAMYLSEIGSIPLLSEAEERELAAKSAAGDKAARDKLVESNLRLVIPVAKAYRGNGLDLIDLIQEGNLGLMKAAEKYDHEKGKFSTYGIWWIRQGITRAITDKGHAIRLPAHIDEALTKLKRTRSRMTGAMGREPTAAELASALSLSETRVKELLSICPDPVSLDMPVGDDTDTFLGSFVANDACSLPEEMLEEQLMREDVHKLLATLSEREAGILRLRYGIGECRTYTLDEVGKVYGLTRERVRQIEKSACAKLSKSTAIKALEYVG